MCTKQAIDWPTTMITTPPTQRTKPTRASKQSKRRLRRQYTKTKNNNNSNNINNERQQRSPTASRRNSSSSWHTSSTMILYYVELNTWSHARAVASAAVGCRRTAATCGVSFLCSVYCVSALSLFPFDLNEPTVPTKKRKRPPYSSKPQHDAPPRPAPVQSISCLLNTVHTDHTIAVGRYRRRLAQFLTLYYHSSYE